MREYMIERGVNRVLEKRLCMLLTAGAEKGTTFSLHVGNLVHKIKGVKENVHAVTTKRFAPVSVLVE